MKRRLVYEEACMHANTHDGTHFWALLLLKACVGTEHS